MRRLGSANAALVWARIEFVCRIDGRDRVEDEDGIWWVVSMPKLSADIGLSQKAIRRTLDNLIAEGHLEAKMVDSSSWDRSLAYRTIGDISAGRAHLPKRADASDHTGTCIGPYGQIDVPKRADVPYIEEVKKKNIIDADDAASNATVGTSKPVDVDALFEAWWSHYPRKVSKGQARTAYKSALKKTTPDTLTAAIKAFATSVADTEAKYIPHGSTWLNGEKWLDDNITPADSESVTEWLRECWNNADTKSVENRSGMTYRPADPPDDVDIREFRRSDRQRWITDNHEEIIRRIVAREDKAA